MKTKKNGVKKKSRLIGKLKGKKRSKILKGGSLDSLYIPPHLRGKSSRNSISNTKFINRETGNINTFKIYDPTNTAIGVHCESKPINLDLYLTITPMVLSVDIMQLAVNTNNINISSSRDGSFMTLTNLPSLLISTNYYGSYYGNAYTSRVNANWCLIEETNELPKTFYRQKLTTTTTNTGNTGVSVNNTEPKIDSPIPISKLVAKKINKDALGITNDDDNGITNEEVFLGSMKEYDDKRLCLYRANIKYKINESDEGEPRELYERIEYVKYIAEWLENIDKNIPNTEQKCDLFGLEPEYIIIHTFTNPLDDIQYTICGYPDQETKQLILKFWQGIWKESFNRTHIDNIDLFIELFNKKQTMDDDKINDKTTDLYKFYSSIRKGIFDYIKARYEEIDISKSATFETHFDNNVRIYFNEIATKYLHKFMAYIKYNFFIFKKVGENYVPAVFNIRELTSIHKPILERINKLIRNELPHRFGISLEENYNPIEKYDIKAEYDEDKEYKLFYSHYRHGQVFHIKTEYLHSMSNISDKAHGYKYGLTLEEIIYNCSIVSDNGITPYFEAVKFIYEVREHQINDYDLLEKQKANKNTRTLGYTGRIMTGKTLKQRLENIESKKNRSDIVYDLYEKDKLLRKKDINNVIKVIDNIQFPQDTFNISQIKFILMFKSSSQEYVFIYVLDDIFYKLVIKSNISNMTDIILIKLNKKINENSNSDFIDKTISFEERDLPQVFKIISNTKLDKEDSYFKTSVQPLILRQFYKPEIINKQYIDTFYYYSTNLFDINNLFRKPNSYKTLLMPNLYDNTIHIPILVQNFNKIIKNNDPNRKFDDPNKIMYEDNKTIFHDCIKEKTCNPSINYIHKNYNNCGYDFIEVIDDFENKLVIYIYPHQFKDIESKKFLCNFMYLESSHIDMLKGLQKLYYNENYNCFVHHTLSPYFSCLHFHIIKKNLYKRDSPRIEKGSFLIQDIYILELINNLIIDKNYYIKYNYSLIKEY